MGNKTTFVFCIIVPLLMCGCARISGKLLIMEANFHTSRGMYTDAISSYLKAYTYPDAAPYAEFGLGSVYFAMGEEQAALERFASAGKTIESLDAAVNRELVYRVHYNTGVVLFSEGDYSGAVDSFRNALKTDGGKKEAKRNLELSLRSLDRETTSGGGRNEGEGADESMIALFEYIRQKELNQWKSREWQEEDSDGPDY